MEKERFRAHAAELGLLLWAVWDPIGAGVPIDEYESYVPVVWRLLAEHAGAEEISGQLDKIAEERMSGGRVSRESVDRLIDWWYWRFDFPVEFEANSQRDEADSQPLA